MSRMTRLHFLLIGAISLFAVFGCAQSLEPVWKREFPKPIEWYVRTSPGILLVKSANNLSALDGKDGRQLWTTGVELSGALHGALGEIHFRGKNLLEVPGMGILLLNRVKLAGDGDGRLIGLNLETGARLWDQAQIDELLTAIPLPDSHDVVLVSMRLERRMSIENTILTAGYVPELLYPYRLRMQRLDALTGETRWTLEYPRTFYPAAQTVILAGDHLFLNYSNILLVCVDLGTGNRVWEEATKGMGTSRPPLPLERTGGLLIYGQKTVKAVDANTNKVIWETKGLGRVAGIGLHDGMLVAIGDKNLVALDPKTGSERWHKKTHGYTTNLLWDKTTDTIVYVDGKGLHTVERTTGKALVETKLDAPQHDVYHPFQIRLAGSEVAVLIANGKVFAYNFKTGKHIVTTGKLLSFHPPYMFLDWWPQPFVGENLVSGAQRESGEDDWEGVRQGTLLTASAQKNLDGYRSAGENRLAAYETLSPEGGQKIWWIDEKTNLQAGFGVAGTLHDVSRQFGLIFAVDKSEIRADAITP